MGLGARGEGDDRGWDGWMASPTQWTLVWVNSGSWWWTGRSGILQFMGSQRVGHNWATELNWTKMEKQATQNSFLGGTTEGWCLLLNMFNLRWLYPCIDFKGPIWHSAERYTWRYKFGSLLATWCEELTHWERPWCWERLKAEGEGDNRGWDGWMASLNQWTWIWASSMSWWWTGKPSVLQSMGSQIVRHDWLHWTELWYKR